MALLRPIRGYRNILLRTGRTKPHADPVQNPHVVFDAGETTVQGAYYTPDYAASIDHLGARLLEAYREGGDSALQSLAEKCIQEAVSEKISDSLAAAISYVITTKNPRLACDIVALACGLHDRQDITPADISRKYGLSRTHVCGQVRKVCEDLGISPLIALRHDKEELGSIHRDANHRPRNYSI